MASGELAAKLSKRRSLQGEDESAALSSLQGSQDFAKTWDVAQELGAGSGKVRASARKASALERAHGSDMLRAGSLQASATDRLMAQAAGRETGSVPGPSKGGKMGRQSTWKQKMQVRMIERPGDVIVHKAARPAAP